MNDFIFQNTTKIYFGKGFMTPFVEELKPYGKKVLLVYGGGSIKKTGLYDKVVAELKAAGLEITEFSGVEPNPRNTTVNKGADICRKEGIDSILAVGGGSSIDCAKLMAAATYYDGDSWDFVAGKATITAALPIFTIPTIAATGSEFDSGSVISNEELNCKIPIMFPLLSPKASLLNPEYTYTVNAFQTACGVVDIMMHILDCSYFTNNEGFDLIDGITEAQVKVLMKNAAIAIKEPENYEARANIMWASSWACSGLFQYGVIAGSPIHAMEHELSAYYDITHGLGIAILFPRWLRYILDEDSAPRIRQLGVNAFDIDADLPAIEAAEKTIDILEKFTYETLGLESSLSKIGIDDSKFREMAEKACTGLLAVDLEGKKKITSFRDISIEDAEAIFRMCL